jgi:uncharacterized protein (UPF0261 family)
MSGDITAGASVVLMGTLDTKGDECAYVKEHISRQGVDVLVVDVGVQGQPAFAADVTRDEVAGAADAEIDELATRGDRGAAIETMGRGAAEIVRRIASEGRVRGIIGLGGTGGTTLITTAMRELPIGVPKVMVSTVAAGDTSPYVGHSDMTLMCSVVDIAGLNQITRRVLGNAAAAVAGMAREEPPTQAEGSDRPMIGATMFGVTTPCVTVARQRLEELGYEVLVFHATGTGGEAMEALIREGFITGVLDITTTELADELVGGVFAARPGRLTVAGRLGVPQVVSLGALDMVNFGPMDTVPEKFRDRLLYKHNPSVTLMRSSAHESELLGRELAKRLNQAGGPTALFAPLRGVSMIDVESEAFYDPDATSALLAGIRAELGPNVEYHELDTDINSPEFALAMADRLHQMYTAPREDTHVVA